MLKNLLAHPLTRGLDLDDPQTTALRRQIIQGNSFLRRVYEEWYRLLAAALPSGPEPVLELGSGAGFLSDFIPDLITSDIAPCPGVRYVLDAHKLPFKSGALRGIVMTDVLHHLSAPRLFFAEASRCVRSGGAVVMIEPWVSLWSRLIYPRLHHEPFEPAADRWEFPASGPLTGANLALPWIIFERDRSQFEAEFPDWRITTIQPFMPFRYLVSGGVSMRQLMPGWTFGLWRTLETALKPAARHTALFALIKLTHTDVTDAMTP